MKIIKLVAALRIVYWYREFCLYYGHYVIPIFYALAKGPNRRPDRIEPHSKAASPKISRLTMRRKDSARGTSYQLAHACGELAQQLG